MSLMRLIYMRKCEVTLTVLWEVWDSEYFVCRLSDIIFTFLWFTYIVLTKWKAFLNLLNSIHLNHEPIIYLHRPQYSVPLASGYGLSDTLQEFGNMFKPI